MKFIQFVVKIKWEFSTDTCACDVLYLQLSSPSLSLISFTFQRKRNKYKFVVQSIYKTSTLVLSLNKYISNKGTTITCIYVYMHMKYTKFGDGQDATEMVNTMEL